MKKIRIVILIVLFSGCYFADRFQSAKRVFRDNKVSIYTNVDSARTTKKDYLLFIVFYDNDSALYNSPITTILKYDTTKTDYWSYRSLTDYRAVVKLQKNEFDALINDLDKYPHDDSLFTRFRDYDPKKSFVFLSGVETLFMYGQIPLDSPKSDIHDLVSYSFGP